MALNHTPMRLTEHWTLEAQREYKRANGNSKVSPVRASGNMLLKFVRKAFTEPNGTSMIHWLEITGFKIFCFPGFEYSGEGQSGDWDLDTPRMTHFNWREYLGTFPPSELEEILEVPIVDVIVAFTQGKDDIFDGDKHWFVLKSAPHAGKWFLVFRRADGSDVICYPDGKGKKGKMFDGFEWTITDEKDSSRQRHFNQSNQNKLVGVKKAKGCDFLFGGWREDRFKNSSWRLVITKRSNTASDGTMSAYSLRISSF